MILSAQAVPSSAMLPCIAALPSGWTAGAAEITNGRSLFWLDSDQAGPRAVDHQPDRRVRHLRAPCGSRPTSPERSVSSAR